MAGITAIAEKYMVSMIYTQYLVSSSEGEASV